MKTVTLSKPVNLGRPCKMYKKKICWLRYKTNISLVLDLKINLDR